MKRLLLTGIIISIGMNFAAAFPNYPGNQTANLTLTTSEAGRFMFELNGFSQQSNGNTLYLNNIQQGNHSLRIFRWRRSFGPHQGYWDVVYQGQLQIPANSHVIASWNQWNGLHASITPLHQQPIPPVQICPPHPNTPPMNGHHPGNGHGNGWNNHYGMGMQPQVFQGFLHQLRKASFDSNRVNLAKNAIRSSGISVQQLQQVLRTFDFDSNRLEVAQYAYAYTADQQNYFLLHNSFDFESNANHLMNSLN